MIHTMTATNSAIVSFDYASLEPELADEARAAAARIRGRLNTSMFETGRDLVAMKARMEHGAFGAWLKAEFNFTARTAQNYMNTIDLLDRKNETVSLLPPTIVYQLAAPSAPAAAVDEVLAAAEAGNVMSSAAVRAKMATAIKAERHATREAKKSPELNARESRARESKAKRDQRLAAEREAEKAKAASEEQERTARLTPLIKRIVAVIGHQDHAALNNALGSKHWPESNTVIRLLSEMAGAAQ